jgi:hypothetical protein
MQFYKILLLFFQLYDSKKDTVLVFSTVEAYLVYNFISKYEYFRDLGIFFSSSC